MMLMRVMMMLGAQKDWQRPLAAIPEKWGVRNAVTCTLSKMVLGDGMLWSSNCAVLL